MIESQRHSYHLVDPSPWPISGSLGALATTVGGVMYMHSFQGGATLLSLGLIFILYTMFVWWRDVLRESTLEGHHTKVVQLGPRYGSISFIVSEVMFLFAFFRASSHSSLAPTVEIGGIWPPKGIGVLDPREIPFLNTPILLSSGAAVTWAHHAILAGKEKRAVYALVATVSLALVFTGFQGMEYYQAPFTISDSIYGSTFFLATGFHGFHVIIGTLFLIICGIRQYLGHLTKEHHVGFEAAAWYWHFVDVVRLFPFFSIYWWGGCSGRLALVLFFAVKAVNGTLFKDFFSCMEEAGPSSGASSSNPDAEERRKEEELRNSKEWKESERHLLKVENIKKSIGQRAKEIAQERGLTPGRCEAVEDAANYIAEDVEDLAENQQVSFLVNLMRDLNNPNSESWERIEEEVKRWRSWED
ncbi:Cytochrome c oxidase subunit 3 (mitochondrion) [Lathyrus oleraceus]|nr:Cytochrome c oxidase subunit 3 [Pisum sativum]